MHNIIKGILALVLCMLCFGCSIGDSSYKSHTETINDDCEQYTINAEILSFKGDTEGIGELNSNIEQEVNEWIDSFKARVPDTENVNGSLPCLQVRHTIKTNNPTIISVVTEKYVYLTGLHGNNWQTSKTLDTTSNKILSLADLFNDETYPKILNQRMQELIDTDTDTYHDLWEIPIIDKNREDKFYIDNKNLVIYYEPYELSYYARGVVEFPIPLEKIRGYIKNEYLLE